MSPPRRNRAKSAKKTGAARTAIRPDSPDDVVETLVREAFVARKQVASATNKEARRRAECRARILHLTVHLLQAVRGDGARLELAAEAASDALKALGVDDFYNPDRRGRAAAKKTLLKVMKRALLEQPPTRPQVGSADKKDALRAALLYASQALRDERESTANIPPTAESPLSHHLAFTLLTFGLRDDAVVATLGGVEDTAVNGMARGLRTCGRELDEQSTQKLEALCAYALWGAGLLTKKGRSDFYGRLR